jgi:hypothetical protein
MRKIQPVLLIFALSITALLLLTACGGNNEPVVTTEPEVISIEEPSVEEVVVTETETSDFGSYGQPIDVPIIDGAIDVQVSRTGENIGYKADAHTLQEMYDYYREQLDIIGWIPGPNEIETVVSRQISLARANEAGDRITISMQHNPVGEFVIVSIFLTRAP